MKKELDYSFGIVSYWDTSRKHASQVSKFSSFNKDTKLYPVDFNNVIGEAEKFMFRDNGYSICMNRKTDQAQINQLKHRINSFYYNVIYNWLINNKLPKNWTTAVYILYYSEFNTFMSEITKVVYKKLQN